MVLAAVLSAIQVLTLAVGLGSLGMRGRALERPLDEPIEMALVMVIAFVAAVMARGA
jgi:hypothetical protein